MTFVKAKGLATKRSMIQALTSASPVDNIAYDTRVINDRPVCISAAISATKIAAMRYGRSLAEVNRIAEI